MITVANTKKSTLKCTQDVEVCGVLVVWWGVGGGGAVYSMIQQLAIIIATPVCLCVCVCVCVCFEGCGWRD